jgi:hypothetical protein
MKVHFFLEKFQVNFEFSKSKYAYIDKHLDFFSKFNPRRNKIDFYLKFFSGFGGAIFSFGSNLSCLSLCQIGLEPIFCIFYENFWTFGSETNTFYTFNI